MFPNRVAFPEFRHGFVSCEASRRETWITLSTIGFGSVLEALDLLVDCKHQRLVPRDPSGPIYEIE